MNEISAYILVLNACVDDGHIEGATINHMHNNVNCIMQYN